MIVIFIYKEELISALVYVFAEKLTKSINNYFFSNLPFYVKVITYKNWTNVRLGCDSNLHPWGR